MSIVRNVVRPAITSVVDADILLLFYYIPAHGQSLSIGDQGFPLTHTVETFGHTVSLYNDIAPIGPGFEVDIVSSRVQSLRNYTEISKETHGWAMFNYMNQEGVLTNQWLYAPAGVGGKTITELTEDGLAHDWGYGNVEIMWNAAANVTPEGRTLRVPFTTWIHGEANSGDDEAGQARYKVELRDYHNRLMNLTGNTFPMLLDQTGKNSSIDIATTLLEYAIDNNDAYMVMPKYWLNRNYNGDIIRLHLDANGYMLQGEYFGRAAAAILNGDAVEAVYPESWSVSSDYMSLTVTFRVPGGNSLVIDNTTLPAAPGHGMSLRYFPEFSKIDATAPVLNNNQITFNFAEPITTDGEFNLGNSLDDAADTDNVQLPCINIRDNSSDISPTQGINLYNWCCQRKFSPTIADGALNRDTDNLWLHGDFSGTIAPSVTVAGRNTEWLLRDMTQCQVSVTSAVNSGSADLWVGDTRILIRFNENQNVTATLGAALRMFLRGGSGGFDGAITGISITKSA